MALASSDVNVEPSAKSKAVYVMAEKEGFEPSRRLPDLHP
jgi:hypothetical protein